VLIWPGGLRGSLPPWVILGGGVGGHYPLGQSYRYGERGTQPAGCWPKTASPPLPRTRKFCRSSSCWATTRFIDRCVDGSPMGKGTTPVHTDPSPPKLSPTH